MTTGNTIAADLSTCVHWLLNHMLKLSLELPLRNRRSRITYRRHNSLITSLQGDGHGNKGFKTTGLPTGVTEAPSHHLLITALGILQNNGNRTNIH